MVLSSRWSKFVAGLATGCALLVTASVAQTPAFPTRPVSLRVAYPPGGPADVAARRIQLPLQNALGKPVIVENFPGASGAIGAMNVLGATPDGHTVLVTTLNDAILAPLAMSQVKYKPDSLRLLAVIYPADFALVTKAAHSFANVDEFIERARQKEISVGSWGYGSAPYLVAADFSAATGARLLDVPYKGVAPVVQALLSGEIDAAFVPVAANTLELIRTGKLKVIGVANTKRNPHLPSVPTLSEGKTLKNFMYGAWAGVFIPTSVPEPIAARLSKEIAEVVKTDEFQRFLVDSAALPVEPLTLSQAAAVYKTEMEKYGRIAKAIKLEPQ